MPRLGLHNHSLMIPSKIWFSSSHLRKRITLFLHFFFFFTNIIKGKLLNVFNYHTSLVFKESSSLIQLDCLDPKTRDAEFLGTLESWSPFKFQFVLNIQWSIKGYVYSCYYFNILIASQPHSPYFLSLSLLITC
jgi:hypothetical protein